MQLSKVVEVLNGWLGGAIPGDPARNGLQVGGDGPVRQVALAVDAKLATFEAAAAAGADLLIVHHGLFWKEPVLASGLHYRRLKFLIDRRLALYASHLPLDAHPRLGNNAQLFQLAGLKPQRRFGHCAGVEIGCLTHLSRPRAAREIGALFERALGKGGRLYAFGPPQVKAIAAVSGGAGGAILEEASACGVELLITGEVTHGELATIEDAGMNVLALGHYLSETVGLLALRRLLAQKLRLKTTFIDCPTDL